MKIVSVIFSVYIAILSTIAYCPEIHEADYEIQSAGQTGENSSHDCDGCCSPFVDCNTCTGFIIENYIYIQPNPKGIFTEININQYQFYVSPFLKGIWQPPRIA
jgi:hypothetical protein